MLRSMRLGIEQRIHLSRKFSLSILYLLDSIFPGIVLIDKLHDFGGGTCFPINGCYGNKKKAIFHLS